MFGNDMFGMAKVYYKTALDNFELYQKNSEQMLRMFMNQANCLDDGFLKNYDEWVVNCGKAFDDHRKLVLDGLDYLSETFEKWQSSQEGSS